MRRQQVMNLACALVLAVAVCGCARSGRQALADARQELADAAYADAVAAADDGLRTSDDPVVTWGLELVKLEGHARAGHTEETKQQLARLERLYPGRIPPTEYSATADQLRLAGQGPAAIEVLDMGLQRYPGDAMIERLIAAAGSGEVGSDELQMLRSLGYID